MKKNQRIISIDTFRGITIFIMVFVNDLAGTPGIPGWMGHMPADADAMSFVDVVFPAFLFIAGMSIPFALKNRLQKGDSFLQLQFHILWRALGLLTLGFFMVNGEENYNAVATGLPLHAWLLLFYTAAILTWNVYTFKNKTWHYLLRSAGIIGLAVLAIVYRSGSNGEEYMQPRWWGILGLIGWAYLFACLFYQLSKAKIIILLLFVIFCIAFYIISKQPGIPDSSYFGWMSGQSGNAAHTSIVLCGAILAQIFFSHAAFLSNRKFLSALIFATLLFAAGYILRPYYKISKIYATPTWCLYSAAICCIIFCLLYWITAIQQKSRWTLFFKPASTNPLLTYIIPGILFSFFYLTKITLFPQKFRYGIYGIAWSLFFAVAVMYIAKGLNTLKIRMQL